MKRSLKTITDFKLHTEDKTSGKVKDLLFDEKQWMIRYIEADFGGFFSSKRILIPKAFLESLEWESKNIPIGLKNDDIDKCPDIDQHLPVSREYETKLLDHYRVTPYWPISAFGLGGNYYPPRPIKVPTRSDQDQDINSVLRSFNEIRGYEIKALDGNLGHIDDLLVDDEDWQIIYVIVDTSNWLPWSKNVIIPVYTMDKINYVNREISIRMHSGSIKNAPEYIRKDPITEEFEKGLSDFYLASLVK